MFILACSVGFLFVIFLKKLQDLESTLCQPKLYDKNYNSARIIFNRQLCNLNINSFSNSSTVQNYFMQLNINYINYSTIIHEIFQVNIYITWLRMLLIFFFFFTEKIQMIILFSFIII